ncbi:uncharacterized protein LOC113324358 [Papaver somniferum]|uniref:uncharacterized protein LOC113324358 n=1 Tax=Papaver somniferum TaxID=3469 RepID=UPI000E6FA7DF|nr:uncharacterized protein LOC113324358 [Papaver somniferum]
MASKNIIVNLNKEKKLDGNNYNIWRRKIVFLLHDDGLQEITEHVMPRPEEGSTAQHRRNLEACQEWIKNDRNARHMILSSMHNNLIGEFENHRFAHDMLEAVRQKFGDTSVAKLRALTMKFDTRQKKPNVTMKKHLRTMSLMIRELEAAGHHLTDEQQVQAVIRSLPNSWDHMKQNMTHNDNVLTFEDISRRVELEVERLEAAKTDSSFFAVESVSHKTNGSKRKRCKGFSAKNPRDGSGPTTTDAPKRKK